MPRLLRTSRRVLAALLALSLAGASRAAIAASPVEEHRCQCAAHGEGHRCACPICAEKARRARRGAMEKLPPCHRALAIAELEAEEAADEAEERAGGAVPCLRPSCGAPDPTGPPRPATEAFTLPEPLCAAARGPCGAPAPAALAPEQREAAPELPPPRAT